MQRQLDLQLPDGYHPNPGQTYTILTASSGVADTLDSVNSPARDGVALAVLYDESTVTLLATLVGDMDVDGSIDFDDIDEFVQGLNDPGAYQEQFGLPPAAHGDTDRDGDQDFDDVRGFVGILVGGSLVQEPQPVPEPSTFMLAAVGLLACLSWLASGKWQVTAKR